MGYIPGKKNELMEIDRLYESISSFSFKKNILNESSLEIKDISSLSKFPDQSLKSNKYFILHHTAGRGTAEQVVDILNTRKNKNGKPIILGIQYIIDRNGEVYKGTKGNKGAHITSMYPSAPKDMSNSTAEGVEIIASDDTDILIPQCKSALRLIKKLGYPLSNVYGHGEVSSNKMKEEGATCKAYAKKYWDTPDSELPDSDPTLGKGGETKKTDNKKDKKEKSDIKKDKEEKNKEDKDNKLSPFCQCMKNEKNNSEQFKFLDSGKKCDPTKSNDDILKLAKDCLTPTTTQTTTTQTSSLGDLDKLLGFILKEDKVSKKTERINNIIKKVL
jgi:hypothetical protein